MHPSFPVISSLVWVFRDVLIDNLEERKYGELWKAIFHEGLSLLHKLIIDLKQAQTRARARGWLSQSALCRQTCCQFRRRRLRSGPMSLVTRGRRCLVVTSARLRRWPHSVSRGSDHWDPASDGAGADNISQTLSNERFRESQHRDIKVKKGRSHYNLTFGSIQTMSKCSFLSS